jgi:hypothetical protein
MTTLLGKTPRTVSIEDSERFNTCSTASALASPPCCDIDNFRIDLVGHPKNPWNKSAALIFADIFLRKYQLWNVDMDDVKEAFFTRIKTMRRELSGIQQRQGGKKPQENRKARHGQRKYTVSRLRFRITTVSITTNLFIKLFHRRLDTAQSHPGLRRHFTMLQRLGVDGMSSDESESEDLDTTNQANPQYNILPPIWRAQELSDWLHVFDSIHMLGRRGSSSSIRGALPRLRRYTEGLKSKKLKWVSRLPRNAYDPHWLASQHNAGFVVQPSQDYDFSHDNSLFSNTAGSSANA